MSPNPVVLGTSAATVLRSATWAPELPKTDSVGNAVVSKASAGCDVVTASIR